MNKNRTTFILSLSIIVMILSLGTLVFFFKIIINKNQHTSATLVALANKMERKNNIDSLTKKISEVELTQQTINGYFVDSTKIDSFIDYLEKLGASASTEVKVQNFDTPTAKNQTNKTLMVTISSTGTFTNVMRTLELLENAPYKIHITKTTFNLQPKVTAIDEKTGKPVPDSSTPIWQALISFSILIS
jgi:predicted O-linked N-acetylglucosamine transferase (SPINDLY family)